MISKGIIRHKLQFNSDEDMPEKDLLKISKLNRKETKQTQITLKQQKQMRHDCKGLEPIT